MVAMLPVGMRKTILRAANSAETLHVQSGWNVNPLGNSTSYANEMMKVKIKGMREAAQQIIKERRCTTNHKGEKMQITPSDALKLIGDLAIAKIAKNQYNNDSKDLRDAHKAVEQYLGTKLEFEIKEPLYYEHIHV